MIDLTIFILKYSFLALIYLFLFWLLFLIAKDLRYSKTKTNNLQAWLKVESGPEFKRPRLLAIKKAITIGRDERNVLVLNDDSVSAFHARVYEEGGRYYIEDLSSTNGTLVDKHMAAEKVPLQPGSNIQIGRNHLIFQEK